MFDSSIRLTRSRGLEDDMAGYNPAQTFTAEEVHTAVEWYQLIRDFYKDTQPWYRRWFMSTLSVNWTEFDAWRISRGIR